MSDGGLAHRIPRRRTGGNQRFDTSDRCRCGDLPPGTVGNDLGDGQQREMEVARRAPLGAVYLWDGPVVISAGMGEMTFPSAEAAIAYARRQGLEFVLRRSKEVEMTGCHRVSTLP